MNLTEQNMVEDLVAENERLVERIGELEGIIEDLDGRSKQRDYWRVAVKSIDLLDLCNARNIAPLKHDINLLRAELNFARTRRAE